MRALTQQDLERLVSPILYAEQQQQLAFGEKVEFSYVFEEADVYQVRVSNEGGQLFLFAHRLKVV